MRYFLTFSCYGSHLHGAEAGSVDRKHSTPGSRLREPNSRLEEAERENMREEPQGLDPSARAVALESLREVCERRGWTLLAAHVRTSHVHVVVESELPPERVMNDLKAYASRRLNQMAGRGDQKKHWARHGSARWLWRDQDVREAITYVVEGQGEPMAVYLGEVP
jgi:REP element-mobilizing transposase RayT